MTLGADFSFTPKGSKRRRKRREVAGPFLDQSSDPKLRGRSTPSEHRTVPVATPAPRSNPLAPPSAFSQGFSNAPHVQQSDFSPSSLLSVLSLLSDDNPITGSPGRDMIEDEADNALTALRQNYPAVFGDGELPTSAKGDVTSEQARALASALSPLPVGNAQRLARALKASEEVVSGARAGSAIGRAVAGRVPAARAVGEAAARQAGRLPAPVRAAAKVGAKAAAYPVRHPIQAPAAFATPQALATGDPLGALKDAATGQGLYANIMANVAGSLGGLPGEAVSIPAAILPGAFLAGKAGVQAAQGDTSEAEALLDEWRDTGLLPPLVEGDFGRALENLGEYPLYGFLEGSGAVNALGRGAGAATRAATGGRVGGLSRAPLNVAGTGINVQREYSRDLFRQGLQRAWDRTGRGQAVPADTMRGRHYLKEAANRFTSGEEAIRRDHRRSDLKALKEVLPKKGPLKRIDRASADVVNLAVERLIRRPESFYDDLPDYLEMLDDAAKAVNDQGKPLLDKRELKANRALAEQIQAGIAKGDPSRVVDAANAFIELQKPILDELVDLKLLTREQAEKASATSFARVHLGADHDPEVGLIDADGRPLSLERLKGEMESRGVAPPGFLSHRAPANSDFYQPSFGGAMLEKGGRTGRAVTQGSQLGGIESMVRQLARSRGLVDRAKAWNKAVDRFGIEVPGVKTMGEARRIMSDPERYGLDPRTNPVAVPRFPFTAKKAEREGALEHQSPALADESASSIISKALDEDELKNLPDDAAVVFMPEKVVQQLRADAAPSGEGLKVAQAATSTFKRAVLPFSVGWYTGNAVDNTLRTVLEGINPAHFYVGAKLTKKLSDEQKAQLLPGAHFSSVESLAPHRGVEAVVKGYDPLSKSVRQMAEWSQKQGWKQAATKAAPTFLRRFSNFLMASNALVFEALPQQGALGKIALKEMTKTRGSWTKAIRHLDEAVDDLAKGLDNPDKIIRLQKDLERVYGNYTRMSPGARKVLSTIAPFWTWMRSAYTFVYWTMPAHHSVQTGLLAATANASRAEREQWGLNKEGEEPVPQYYQGIPLPDGGIFPLASYNSFDYASDPIAAVAKVPLAQVRNIAEALAGRDWKGDKIPDDDRLTGALWATASSFIPLVNIFMAEEGGRKVFQPHVNLPESVSKSQVDYAREPKQQVTVPAGGKSSSGGGVWRSGSSSSSGGGIWR